MKLDYNIEHNYDLHGMSVGDCFLGCNKCWFQLPPKTAAHPVCPECGNRLSILNVKGCDLTAIYPKDWINMLIYGTAIEYNVKVMGGY